MSSRLSWKLRWMIKLGRGRCERSDEQEGTPPINYRNGYRKKTVKTQLGVVDIKVPRNDSF